MKKYYILAFLIVFVFTSYTRDFSTYNVSLSIEPSKLLSGEQRDTIDTMITPKPSDYFSSISNVNINYYILTNFGIDLSYSLYRQTRAESDLIIDSLNLFNHQTIDFGFIYRYIKYDYARKYYSVYISTGVTYSMITYDKEFEDIFNDLTYDLYKIIPGWGGYINLGVRYNFNQFMYVGASVKLNYLNNSIDVSGLNFDGFYTGIPLCIGISI